MFSRRIFICNNYRYVNRELMYIEKEMSEREGRKEQEDRKGQRQNVRYREYIK